MRTRLCDGALTALLSLLAVASSEAATTARQVLLLQSSDRGSLVFDRVTADFRAALQDRAGEWVTVVEFVVAPAGFAESPDEAIVQYLRALFADRAAPDLIVTIGGPATAFAIRNRQQLFPTTPLIYAATEARYLRSVMLADNETSVLVSIDYVKFVDSILDLLPRTRHLFIVMGSGPVATFWREQLGREFAHYRDRLTILWSDDLPYEQVLDRAAHLPPDSAIFFLTSLTDAKGGWQAEKRALNDLSSKANAPLFGLQSVWLGEGTVGGTLLFIEDLGAAVANAAVRILRGESPKRVAFRPLTLGRPAFDARQLQRWNLSESRLPPGSEVRFRRSSLWRDYRREVLGVVAVVLVQSLSILGLLYHRRRRQRAELESRRNLSLAADASRRLTMSALTGSIAHDLSQPLNSIEHNAYAGEMLIASNRATSESLQAILSDIRSANVRASQIVERHRAMLRNRQLQKQPIDIHAVVRESVALVEHETRARRVDVDLALPPSTCCVAGDHVLLQQVLVNLLMNAMDAMTDTSAEQRRIRLRSHVGAQSVEITVRDAGIGLPATVNGQMFEPFVTTKSAGIGIGLTIARTIVEAHGGSLEARNNEDGGATFSLTLPRRESADIADAAPATAS